MEAINTDVNMGRPTILFVSPQFYEYIEKFYKEPDKMGKSKMSHQHPKKNFLE